jgi:hypothetical protein
MERAVMASIDELKSWFERDLKFATWDENVSVDESDPKKFEVKFYTETNEYSLAVLPQGDDSPHIDATVKSRKPRAGQASPRVRRLLPVGRTPLNERAWRRILGAIVGLELVRVHRSDPAERPDQRDEENLPRPARVGARRSASASAAGC